MLLLADFGRMGYGARKKEVGERKWESDILVELVEYKSIWA